MNNGYIKLYRDMQDCYLWTNEKFTKGQAWIDLLLMANHKDSTFSLRGIQVEVKRGELARGETFLSEKWRWSRNKLRRYLNELTKRGKIEQQKSRVISVISILNYDYFQIGLGENETTEQHETKQETKQQNEQQKNIYNNVKNVKEVHVNNNKLLFKSTENVTKIKIYVDYNFYYQHWVNSTDSPGINRTKERDKKIKQRTTEDTEFKDNFTKCIIKIKETPFLMGDNKNNWKVGFDWLIKNGTNYLKVLEGRYE